MKPKKFTRHRTLDELRVLCAERGIDLNTERYDTRLEDHVCLRGTFADVDAWVIYNTFNGLFFGKTISGGTTKFNECSQLDGEAWYAAILDLLFVGEVAEC